MISGLWSLFFLISSQKGELPNMQSGVKNVPKTQPNPVGAQDSYKGYLIKYFKYGHLTKGINMLLER